VHSVFPPPEVTGHSGQDPVSLKKLLDGEGLWDVRKEILGWMFDGASRCIEITEGRQDKIRTEIKAVLRIRSGVPFNRVEKIVGKLRHAAIGVPAGKYLFGPINRLIGMQPKMVFWDRAPEAERAMRDWRQLIHECAKEPTNTRELVPGELDYTGTLDASGEGAGGVWLPGERRLKPTVWRVKWPQEIRDRLVTDRNPDGDITNSDLEMLGALLGWIVLEAITCVRMAHVGMCSDNSPTVAWQTRGASKQSDVANRLLRILAIRMRVKRASPLVTKHLAGERNHLGDMPSRSFGYNAKWHCERDIEFLALFNQTFPLPAQNSWTGFQIDPRVSRKCISELLTGGSPMEEWRQLPTLGSEYGQSGRPSARITECVRAWTGKTLKQSPGWRRDSEGKSGVGRGKLDKSALEWSARDSGASRRRSQWTRVNSHCIKRTGPTTSSPSS
jgi:hypothetical protein